MNLDQLFKLTIGPDFNVVHRPILKALTKVAEEAHSWIKDKDGSVIDISDALDELKKALEVQ